MDTKWVLKVASLIWLDIALSVDTNFEEMEAFRNSFDNSSK